MTGLQRENVTKYGVLLRNHCIIDARVGSSSYCLSAQGRTCLYDSAATERMKPSKKDSATAEFIITDILSEILYFSSHGVIKSERSAFLLYWSRGKTVMLAIRVSNHGTRLNTQHPKLFMLLPSGFSQMKLIPPPKSQNGKHNSQ